MIIQYFGNVSLGMRIPVNGSMISNLLLVGVGVALGASGYWVIDRSGEPKPENWEESAVASEAERSGSKRAEVRDAMRSGSASSEPGQAVERPEMRMRRAVDELDPRVRSEMLRRAGAEGARSDLAEALKLGMALERPQDRLDYYRGLFGVWSEEDPEAALDYASRTFPAGTLHAELVGLAMNKWAATSPQDARLWAERNLSGPLKGQAMTDLMVGWTRRSPAVAAEWLENSDQATSSMVSAVGVTWAEQDASAAAEWASGLSGYAARRTATLAVANEWARQDPPAAAAFFEEATKSELGPDLATILADVWGASDPQAASLWVSELPDGPVRDQAAGTLATVWATVDIQAAARWSEGLEDASMREQVVAHLGTSWGALEPDRAVEWLMGLPPELASEGLTGAFNSWGSVDAAGMRDWVESTEVSAVSDQARKSLADVLSRQDILGSIEGAMGISSAVERNDAVARYFREWRKVDDASAQEWLGEAWAVMPVDLQERVEREQRARVAARL